jgi:prepilin-type N-terminal cleavage/methylation domain-containing protein
MTSEARTSTQAGFTLLELTVVLGVLAAFTLFLIQILIGGVELFDEGESGQTMADRTNVAAQSTREALESMVGPVRPSFERGPPDARLLVQWTPLGLVQDEPAALVQALRSTVALDPVTEDRLLARVLREQAVASAASGSDDAVGARLAELVAAAPRTGRGGMLLLPWPAGDADGALLDLRIGRFLPGERIAVDRRRSVSLIDVADLRDDPVSAELLRAHTELLASGLLHVEFRMWSQYTRDFEGRPGENGPEWVWDSARAGLLAEHEDPRQRFSLDLGPASLEDATDDVHPRWLRVTLVVAQEPAEARLAEELSVAGTELRLIESDALPELTAGSHLKIGGEWLRVGSAAGTRVSGLRRGERNTKPRPHRFGAPVRIGRTVELTLRVPHGKDDWNG